MNNAFTCVGLIAGLCLISVVKFVIFREKIDRGRYLLELASSVHLRNYSLWYYLPALKVAAGDKLTSVILE